MYIKGTPLSVCKRVHSSLTCAGGGPPAGPGPQTQCAAGPQPAGQHAGQGGHQV